MNDVHVVIPFGGDCTWRIKALHWNVARYRREHPDWPVTVASFEGTPWSKGAAVNPVVASLDPDIVIVADADSFVAPDLLRATVERAQRYGWAYPHGKVRRICEPDTRRILDGEQVDDPATHVRPSNAAPGGGIVVATRRAWGTVGGIDEHFQGWGGEDQALGLAFNALVGSTPAPPPSDILWHLWHPPAPNWHNPSKETRARFHQYLAARKRPDRFRKLIGE